MNQTQLRASIVKTSKEPYLIAFKKTDKGKTFYNYQLISRHRINNLKLRQK